MRVKSNNKSSKSFFKKIFSISIIIIIILFFMLLRYFKLSFEPVNPNDNNIVVVNIPMGSSEKNISYILKKNDLIKSKLAFNVYSHVHNYDNFQAGSYNLKKSMNMHQIVDILNGMSPQTLTKVTIREGDDIEQIGNYIQDTYSVTGFTKSQFLELMKNQSFLNKLDKEYPQLLSSSMSSQNVRYHLEGYLYPLTYNVYHGETMEKLVDQMVESENRVLSPYYSQIKKENLTVQQFLTLASLVEKEGATTNVRRKIAGVFLNRIAAGMPLQSDISVMYALNKHTTELTNKDVEVNSPYNLYINKGFGPGPFDSPSLNAMKAVLYPLDRDKHYLYFVANLKTGKVTFSQTYQQHLKNSAKVGL